MARPGPKRGAIAIVVAAIALLAAPGESGAAPNPATTSFPLGSDTRATGLVAGPQESLWFIGPTLSAGVAADVLGRFAPGGAKTEFALPPRSASGGGKIALGPDGNLWFSDPLANAVGRLTPDGQVSQYPLPSAGAEPGALTAGPGGSIWFVEEGAGRVGRVDMDGVVAEFPLAAGSRPTGIAVGPDGALWVVENGRARITRMAAGGAVTASHALPDPGSEPFSIVLGPGGELWFSQEGAPRIGRISATGAIEEFRIPGQNGTRELALGSDGNLWFTTGYAIGSIAASGETGEPECVDARCRYPINALARGPDGELWFATDAAVGSPPGRGGGLVGRFLAPELELRLGRRASPVNDGLTTVALSCHGGAAGQSCGGWLRLTAKLPARFGGAQAVLDRRRYRLQPATGRRLPLRLTARGARALRAAKRLRVVVSATSGRETVRRVFVLRARSRR